MNENWAQHACVIVTCTRNQRSWATKHKLTRHKPEGTQLCLQAIVASQLQKCTPQIVPMAMSHHQPGWSTREGQQWPWQCELTAAISTVTLSSWRGQ